MLHNKNQAFKLEPRIRQAVLILADKFEGDFVIKPAQHKKGELAGSVQLLSFKRGAPPAPANQELKDAAKAIVELKPEWYSLKGDRIGAPTKTEEKAEKPAKDSKESKDSKK